MQVYISKLNFNFKNFGEGEGPGKWPISETIICIVVTSFGGQLNGKKWQVSSYHGG